MVDLFACVLYTKPATHASVSGIDVAWLLTKEIEKIDAAPPRKPSVEELEEILKSDVERKIVIQPDGSIRAE